jgi:hypothetical protein
LFNGSTDNLSAASNAAFGFGTGDFTIDLWVYVTNTSNAMSLVDLRNGVESTTNPLLYMAIGGGISWLISGVVRIASAAITANSWVHIAVSRSSASTKLYINGTQAGSTYSDTNNYTQSSAFIGRGSVTTTLYVNGYISNVRLVKGTAVYTGNFTPPTLAFLQTSGAASAASYPSTTNVNTSFAASSTSLLLNLADSNYNSATDGVQNNTFIDSSNYAFPITRTGTPTQGSITPYWPNGQWGNYFNGSSSLNLATNAIPASGAFTFETFVYVTGTAASQVIAAQYPNGTASGRLQILWNDTANKFTVVVGASNIFVSDATYSANTWLYLVVQRDASNVWSMYVNGTRNTATVTSATAIDTAVTYIGNRNTGGGGYTGYISNLRVVTSALYSGSTITVPTTPFSVSTTNQVLLTCYSNRFIDANTATTAKAITVNSTPTVQAFQPFSPTASYTTALYGGSGYFNGSSYLSVASNAALALGTGDFTIEFWIYPIVIPGGFTSIYVLGASLANTMFINFRGSGTIGLTDGGSVYATTAFPLVANNWYHIAVVRSSGSS